MEAITENPLCPRVRIGRTFVREHLRQIRMGHRSKRHRSGVLIQEQSERCRRRRHTSLFRCGSSRSSPRLNVDRRILGSSAPGVSDPSEAGEPSTASAKTGGYPSRITPIASLEQLLSCSVRIFAATCLPCPGRRSLEKTGHPQSNRGTSSCPCQSTDTRFASSTASLLASVSGWARLRNIYLPQR